MTEPVPRTPDEAVKRRASEGSGCLLEASQRGSWQADSLSAGWGLRRRGEACRLAYLCRRPVADSQSP